MNRRHMIDDHHGRTAGRATLLARAMDEIFGTHRIKAARTARSAQSSRGRGQVRRSIAISCPQHQQLNVLGDWRAAKQDKPAAEPDQDEIEQTKGHNRSSSPTADVDAGASLHLRARPTSGTPQGGSAHGWKKAGRSRVAHQRVKSLGGQLPGRLVSAAGLL
jgi:hypothetical protein